MLSKTVFPLTVAILLIAVVDPAAELLNRVIAFPENPTYGYIKVTKHRFNPVSEYCLIKFPASTEHKDYVVLDTISSLCLPQLCDTNAVSYRTPAGWHPDSSMLIVAEIGSSNVEYDTLLIYEEKSRTERANVKLPCLTIHSIGDHLFYRPDSLLFCMPPSIRWDWLGIYRIVGNNTYEYVDGFGGCSRPVFANDFSQVLFSRGKRGLSRRTGVVADRYSTIWAYDLDSDSVGPIQPVVGSCGTPRRRTASAPIYSVCGIDWVLSDYRTVLAILDDSVPQPIVDLDSLPRIVDFFLYPDSILLLHAVPDTSYGFCGQDIHFRVIQEQ